MKKHRGSTAAVWVLAVLLGVPAFAANSKLVLKKAFVNKYKNRVTLDADFLIDHAHKKPNRISRDGEDGDLHFSGRCPTVGLPMVSEIVNAARPAQKAALTTVHDKEGTGDAVHLAGVWRLWFEHPPSGGGQQVQGDPVPVPKNTNPDHVFELHPLTEVGTAETTGSFEPVPGFEAYDAKTAFGYYEGMKVTVKASKSAILLSSSRAKYNYAEFVIEIAGKREKVADGYFVLAEVLDPEGNPVADGLRRMAFAAGTAPAEILKKSKKGDRLHVLGIPRINLEEIATAVKAAKGKQKKIPLPYEMIIVGVTQD